MAPLLPRHHTLTAPLILAELHDFRRFGSARALMAFLGLVPGEDSSGEKHRRGRITKMGNSLVRQILVQASSRYQHRPGVGGAFQARRTGQPARVVAIAEKAQQRLGRRFRRMLTEHKPTPKWRSWSRGNWPDSSGLHCTPPAVA